MRSDRSKTIVVAAAVAVGLGGVGWGVSQYRSAGAVPSGGSVEFTAPARTPDLSSQITDRLAAAKPPSNNAQPITLPAPPASRGFAPPPSLPASAMTLPEGYPSPQELSGKTQDAAKQAQADAQRSLSADAMQAAQAARSLQDDPVMNHLARYGTPVTKQILPVGGLTMWTVISKSGKPVQLYTTADGKALFSGVVWNLESGRNVSEALNVPPSGPDANFASRLPQVVAPAVPKSSLVSGTGVTTSAFDGKAPSSIPDAIKMVDGLAGYKEGKGGPADTLYVIIDPRCPYCRRAFLNTRDYVKSGVTIKWIPTAALGRPEQGLPLGATILRASNADVVTRVLGNHEQIPTPPTDFELKQLENNLDFMFEAFKQNNEPNPGVPVAFFVDRRTGKARMMMGVSEQAVIEDILGKPKK